MEEPRWLDEQEIKAWRPLAALALLLPSQLDEPLQAHGLTFFEYTLLVALSSAPDRTVPMSELAHLANGSLSRTSHTARRLEGRGHIRRHRCPNDGRVTLVTLTDEGYRQLAAAAPDHVASVRRVFLDALTPEQARELGHLITTMLVHFAPVGPWAESVQAVANPDEGGSPP